MSKRPSGRLALLTPPLCFILTACATTTGSAGTRPVAGACAAFSPIYWSTQDSDQTIRAVKAHNAAWKAVCER